MSIRTPIISGSVSNIDSDIMRLLDAIIYAWGVVEWLEVTTGQISEWYAYLIVTRTGGETFPLQIHIDALYSLDTSGTKKVWIEIDQTKIDDPMLVNSTMTNVASVNTWASYPVYGHIKLASIASWTITDEREYITLKPFQRKWNTPRQLWYTDWNGDEQSIDLWTATQVLTSNGASQAPEFISPATDINALSSDDTNGYLDKFIVYVPWIWNRKRDVETVIKNIIRQCWENISAWDVVALWKPTATSATAWWSTWWSTYWILYSTTYYYQSQTFSLASDTKIKKITVSLRKVWSPTWNLYMRVHTSTGGFNNPMKIADSIISEASLTTSFADYDFWFFTPFYAEASVTYYITIYWDRAVNTSNYSEWAGWWSYGSWNGFRVNNWLTFTSLWADHNFTVHSQNYDNKFYKWNCYMEDIVGIAVYWWSTNDYIEAWNDIVTTSWLTAWSTYYAPTTAGAPTTTPTMLSIWKALSTTLMKWILQQFVPVAWTSVSIATTSNWNSYNNNTSYVIHKRVKVMVTWTYTTGFRMRWNNVAWTCYARVYKNWVAYWTERTIASSPWTETEYTEDLSFNAWDLYEIRTKVSVWTAWVAITQAYLKCSYRTVDALLNFQVENY